MSPRPRNDSAGQAGTAIELAHGATAVVTVSVTGVSDGTTHAGALFATANGVTFRVVGLSVTRSPGPSDLLVDTASDGGLVANSTVTSYRRQVTLIPTRPTNIDFRMQLSTLNAPDGNQIPMTASVNGLIIPSDTARRTNGQPFTFEIAAELSEPGDYTGLLVLTVEGKISTTRIKITRTSPTLQLTVTDPSAPSASILVKGGTRVRMSVSAAFPTTMQRPFLTLGVGGTSNAAVDPGNYTVSVDNTPVPVGGTFTLAADTARTVVVELSDIGRAGNYTGTVQFTANGMSGNVDKTFAFSARRSWVVAALVFAMGIAASIALSLFFGVRAKTYAAGAAAVRLRDQLRSVLASHQVGEDDRELASALEQRIAASVDQVTAPYGADVDALAPIPARIDLLRRVVVVTERLPDAGLDVDARARVLQQLATVRSFIASESPEKEPPKEFTDAMTAAEAAVDVRRRLDRRRDQIERALGVSKTSSRIRRAIPGLRPGSSR